MITSNDLDTYLCSVSIDVFPTDIDILILEDYGQEFDSSSVDDLVGFTLSKRNISFHPGDKIENPFNNDTYLKVTRVCEFSQEVMVKVEEY